MFLIRTSLAASEIHGVGVFAEEYIEKGRIIWRFNPQFDKIIKEEDLEDLPDVAQAHIKRHAQYVPEMNHYRLSGDNDQYMNHNTTPNLYAADLDVLISTRPIKKGEELTIDYNEISMECKKYGN